jgi:hypothetical protein
MLGFTHSFAKTRLSSANGELMPKHGLDTYGNI